MPKQTNPLQRAVMYLESLKSNDLSVIESAMLVDASTGNEREVDVVLKGEINGHQVAIGIEVRDHKRPADVTWIEQMYAKHSKLPIDKLILVSGSGFTCPARTQATIWHIELVDVSEGLRELRDSMKRITTFDFLEIKAYCLVNGVTVDGKTIVNAETEPQTLNDFVKDIVQLQRIQDEALGYINAGEESMAIVFPEASFEQQGDLVATELTILLQWGKNKNVPASVSHIRYDGTEHTYIEYGENNEFFALYSVEKNEN